MTRALSLSLCLVASSACTGLSAARRAELESDAQPALDALRAADFDAARTKATEALAREQRNSRAAGVLALALYRQAAHDLVTDALTLASNVATSALFRAGAVNLDFLDFAAARADQRLADLDRHLAVAQADPGFTLELCLACWEVDWNRSGEVDARDRRLFEVERDGAGELYPADDPRRRPTFRFDVADVAWFRAMVSFQRGVLALAQAFDPNRSFGRRPEALVLKVRDPKKLLAARDFALEGLAHAEACRALVLAEEDDEREWLPSPRQKSHAIPLPVDEALFDTWGGVLADVRRLLRGEEGLSMAALFRLSDKRWDVPPAGFLDVGALFAQPRDYVVTDDDARLFKKRDAGEASEVLGRLLGPAYKAKLPESPLLRRLERMKGEVDRHEESVERKLRYLLWLN